MIFGDTFDPNGAAWRGLSEIIEKKHAGHDVSLALIDAGFRTGTVYRFCENYANGVMPCMGESSVAYGKKYFMVRDVAGHSCKRVDVQTALFKSELYGFLQKSPNDAGGCHFPADYGEEYFKQLTAEKRIKERGRNGTHRYVWKKTRERNEAIDCRVYATCALYVFSATLADELGRDGDLPWAETWELLENR